MDKIASLKKEEKNRKKDIDNLASEISKLEAELEKPPSQDLPTKDELTAISVRFSVGLMLSYHSYDIPHRKKSKQKGR